MHRGLCYMCTAGYRWKYEKLPHLHCMAFRKTHHTRRDYSDVMLHHSLLAIAQDRQTDQTMRVTEH